MAGATIQSRHFQAQYLTAQQGNQREQQEQQQGKQQQDKQQQREKQQQEKQLREKQQREKQQREKQLREEQQREKQQWDKQQQNKQLWEEQLREEQQREKQQQEKQQQEKQQQDKQLREEQQQDKQQQEEQLREEKQQQQRLGGALVAVPDVCLGTWQGAATDADVPQQQEKLPALLNVHERDQRPGQHDVARNQPGMEEAASGGMHGKQQRVSNPLALKQGEEEEGEGETEGRGEVSERVGAEEADEETGGYEGYLADDYFEDEFEDEFEDDDVYEDEGEDEDDDGMMMEVGQAEAEAEAKAVGQKINENDLNQDLAAAGRRRQGTGRTLLHRLTVKAAAAGDSESEPVDSFETEPGVEGGGDTAEGVRKMKKKKKVKMGAVQTGNKDTSWRIGEVEYLPMPAIPGAAAGAGDGGARLPGGSRGGSDVGYGGPRDGSSGDGGLSGGLEAGHIMGQQQQTATAGVAAEPVLVEVGGGWMAGERSKELQYEQDLILAICMDNEGAMRTTLVDYTKEMVASGQKVRSEPGLGE